MDIFLAAAVYVVSLSFASQSGLRNEFLFWEPGHDNASGIPLGACQLQHGPGQINLVEPYPFCCSDVLAMPLWLAWEWRGWASSDPIAATKITFVKVTWDQSFS